MLSEADSLLKMACRGAFGILPWVDEWNTCMYIHKYQVVRPELVLDSLGGIFLELSASYLRHLVIPSWKEYANFEFKQEQPQGAADICTDSPQIKQPFVGEFSKTYLSSCPSPVLGRQSQTTRGVVYDVLELAAILGVSQPSDMFDMCFNHLHAWSRQLWKPCPSFAQRWWKAPWWLIGSRGSV